MERNSRVETEKKVDALFTKADHGLTAAETAKDQKETVASCREAVWNLLFAFLLAKGESEPLDAGLSLLNLWEKCVRLDPEILPLAGCIWFIQNEEEIPSTEEGREMLLDAANEVWDFIYGSLTE